MFALETAGRVCVRDGGVIVVVCTNRATASPSACLCSRRGGFA